MAPAPAIEPSLAETRSPPSRLKRGLLVALAMALLGAAGVVARNWLADPREEAAGYLAQGDFAAARIHAVNSIEKYPEDARARILLAEVLSAQGELEPADRLILEAARLGHDMGEVDRLRAHLLLRLGAYDRIEAELHPKPDHLPHIRALVLATRGYARLAAGASGDARALFDEALASDGEHPEALIGKAQLAYLARDEEAAFALVQRAVRHAPDHARAQEFLGTLLRLRGNTDEAVAAYERAARADRFNIVPHLFAAETLLAAGRPRDAQKQVDQARKRSPNAVAVHHVQALVYFFDKEYERTLAITQKIVKDQPAFMPAMLLAGMTHLARGELNQADDALRKVLATRPADPMAQRAHAATLIRMGRIPSAFAVLEAALAEAPNDPALLMLAAEAHAHANDFSKATMYFERAASVDPANADARARAAVARYFDGQIGTGLAALEKVALEHDGNIGTEYVLGTLLLKQREYTKALSVAARLQARHAGAPLGHHLAGVAQIGLGDHAAAKKHFEQALALAPGYWPAAINAARLDLAAGDATAARRRLQEVLASNKMSVDAMIALLQLSGDRGQFVESLELASRAEPGALNPRLVLARAYLDQGLGARALAVAGEAAAIAPDQPQTSEVLGMAQIAAGQHSEALVTFRKLAAGFPDSVRFQVRLARAHAALSDVTGAEKAYRKALALKPGDIEAQLGLARLYAQGQGAADALQIAAQLRATHPRSSVGYSLAGDLHMGAKRYSEAMKAYDRAHAVAPSGDIVVRRHAAHLATGHEPGEAMLIQWLSAHPNDLVVRMYLAERRYRAGQYRDALEQYTIVIRLDPNNAFALNNMASAYSKLDDARALGLAEAAHALQPDDPDILDTLGLALMRFGDPHLAVEALKKAVARAPDATDIQVNYAMSLARVGERKAGREQLKQLGASGKTVSLEPEVRALLEGK